MVVFGDKGGVAIPLAVAAAGVLIGGVGGLDFPFTRKEEYVGAHLLTFFWCGGHHHQGGVFQVAGSRIRVEETGRGDRETFRVENGGFQVDQ